MCALSDIPINIVESEGEEEKELINCPHKESVTNMSVVSMWWGCVPPPIEVRSLAHRGCVFLFACVWVCVSREWAKSERETLSLLHKQA